MEKKFVSVVTYLHNHEMELVNFLDKNLGWIREHFDHFELICVDDDCTDKTIEVLRKYVEDRQLAHLASIVRMGTYQGLEASMNAGRDAAIGDFVFEFDTPVIDYGAEVLSKAYKAIEEGADISIASPMEGSRLSSRIFYGIFNHYSHSETKIGSDVFRIVSRRAINRIKSISDFIPYRKVLYANCGLKVEILRYQGDKSVKTRQEKPTYERVNLAFDSFVYFTNFLERVSMFISAFFLLFSIGSVAYALWDYLVNGSVIEGWTSIICFLSFGFFGVFVLLTIILKYLSVILNLIFKRQKYLVSSIEKVGGGR